MGLPGPGQLQHMSSVACLVRMVLHLVDTVAKFKLSDKTRQQVADVRNEQRKASEAEKRVQQEQRMQQKKLEKRKKEEGDAANLTPEAQRKREEKEHKKSLKSRMPRMKMAR